MPIEHCRIFYFKIETLKLSDFDPFFLFIENNLHLHPTYFFQKDKIIQ